MPIDDETRPFVLVGGGALFAIMGGLAGSAAGVAFGLLVVTVGIAMLVVRWRALDAIRATEPFAAPPPSKGSELHVLWIDADASKRAWLEEIAERQDGRDVLTALGDAISPDASVGYRRELFSSGEPSPQRKAHWQRWLAEREAAPGVSSGVASYRDRLASLHGRRVVIVAVFTTGITRTLVPADASADDARELLGALASHRVELVAVRVFPPGHENALTRGDVSALFPTREAPR